MAHLMKLVGGEYVGRVGISPLLAIRDFVEGNSPKKWSHRSTNGYFIEFVGKPMIGAFEIPARFGSTSPMIMEWLGRKLNFSWYFDVYGIARCVRGSRNQYVRFYWKQFCNFVYSL